MKTDFFQIGTFAFSLTRPDDLPIPEHFFSFLSETPESRYHYTVHAVEKLPEPEGIVVASRPNLAVYLKEGLETRQLALSGSVGYYALCRETASDAAEIFLDKEKLRPLAVDPVFVSLLALERRLIDRGGLILHCAYTRHQDGAILFSAPSETGKTTQANLWEQYRGSETINGDRALLQKTNGVWTAHGWPVCGSSGVCRNEPTPIRAIVMLIQAKENTVRRLPPAQAFAQLFSQITVNRWNRQAATQASSLLDSLISEVPVWHLACNISEDAVNCLHTSLYPEQ